MLLNVRTQGDTEDAAVLAQSMDRPPGQLWHIGTVDDETK